MVRCPTTGEQVTTGVIVDAKAFTTIKFQGHRFRCDACSEVHTWDKKDAMFQSVKALHRLTAVLKEDGVLLVGGEFGTQTRNVQFHRDDHFESWKEFSREPGSDGAIRINKRVRSLGHWHEATAAAGLTIIDVIRTEQDPGLTTPENDLLVLKRR